MLTLLLGGLENIIKILRLSRETVEEMNDNVRHIEECISTLCTVTRQKYSCRWPPADV